MSEPFGGAAAGAILFAAAVLPGGAVLLLLRPRIDRAGATGAALALSPVLGGVLVVLARLAGAGAGPALFGVVGGAARVAALAGSRRHPEASVPAAGSRRVAWIAAAIATVLVGGILASSEWARVTFDAWTHEPIVRALRTSSLPPGDPWYAGLPLRYAWIYHAWAAALAAATGLDNFTVMAFLATASLAATALSVGHLAALLHGRAAGWATAFVLLGLNGGFLHQLPLIALQVGTGSIGGQAELERVFGGVWTNADRAADLLRWFGGQTWFGNKFLGATPLSLGLAALCAWLAGAGRLLLGAVPDRREAPRLALATFSAALLHPVLLVFLGTTTALLWTGSFLGLAGERRAALAATTPLALAVAAGGVPAALFYALFVARAGDVPTLFDFSWPKLVGLVACTLPGLVFAALALFGPRRREPGFRRWSLAVGAALVASLLLRLPGEWPFFTVDKTSYLAWIPLALAGGGAFAAFLAARRPVVRAVLAAGMLLPATVLSLVSTGLDPRFTRRQPFDLPVFALLREVLPADAVLVAPPGDADPAVFLSRDLWTVERWDGTARGHDPAELARRMVAADTLFREGRISPEAKRAFEALPRPLFALWPDQAGTKWPRHTPGAGHRRFVVSGTRPPWVGALPVSTFGPIVTLSPLNAAARKAWPEVAARGLTPGS
jgi:hypothetical protein